MFTHEIKYAKSGNLNIAYQVYEEGEEYLIIIPGWVSNIEEVWNFPGFSEFINALAFHRRVVLFDKRGTGLSDRVNAEDLPSLAVRIDDLSAIMDQEGIQKAAMLGVSEGGPMAILFAATFPERVHALIIIGSYASWLKSSHNPEGVPIEIHEKTMARVEEHWAQGFGLKGFAPSWYGNPFYEKIWASFLRKSASPNTAKVLYRMNLMIDVSHILPEIRQPCLILHRREDKIIPVTLGRQLAQNIPGARWLELEGADHLFWIDYDGTVKKEIIAFLGHPVSSAPPTSAIFTVLLVASSTEDTSVAWPMSNHANEVAEIVQHEDFSLLSFRSPNQAFSIAKDRIKQAAHAKVLMHTGVVNLGSKTITGPAVEVLEMANTQITDPGIWVSQICQQFLTGPQINWPAVKSLPSKSYSYSLNWYLLGVTSKRERLESYLLHQDDKLKVSDIEALLSLKDYLEAHFLDNPSLKELYYYAGLNSFKLKYGFKKLFGVPVKKYLKDLRLTFARQLLRETDLPVQEIARKISYGQPASFSRAYMEKFGISPQEDKKSALSGTISDRTDNI